MSCQLYNCFVYNASYGIRLDMFTIVENDYDMHIITSISHSSADVHRVFIIIFYSISKFIITYKCQFYNIIAGTGIIRILSIPLLE